MVGLMTWMRSVLGSSVDDIFCVSCRSRRTVDRVDVIEAGNARGGYKRLIGRCQVCHGKTSTFVS